MSVLRSTKDFAAAKKRMKCEPILMNKQAANKSMWNLREMMQQTSTTCTTWFWWLRHLKWS